MPRVDMILGDMMDEIVYAKRTLILQHTFNRMKTKGQS